MNSLVVFGQHPFLRPGFNGVMSVFEARGFARLGYTVTLAIPFLDASNYQESIAFLQAKGLIKTDLNDLPKFGGRFEISPVYPDGTGFPSDAVVIYQHTRQDVWDSFESVLRTRPRLLTKNFPKFVSGPDWENDQSVINQIKTFDLLACALKEDYTLLAAAGPNHIEANKIAYVPRGADAQIFHPSLKASQKPTIALDKPIGDYDTRTIEHLFEPILHLKKYDYRDLRCITVGQDIPEIRAKGLKPGPFTKIAEHFFNRSHVYCTMDYQYAPDHLQADICRADPDWSSRAIYELQNIEAQMSGAPIVGYQRCLIPELYEPGHTGFTWRSKVTPGEIYRSLKFALDNRLALSRYAREFALKHHTWERSIALWDAAIQKRLNGS